MPATEYPQSYDPSASEPGNRLESIRRSRAFRYGAIVVCGLGLATAGSTLLRLSQGWRQLPAQVAEAPSPPPVSNPATEAGSKAPDMPAGPQPPAAVAAQTQPPRPVQAETEAPPRPAEPEPSPSETAQAGVPPPLLSPPPAEQPLPVEQVPGPVPEPAPPSTIAVAPEPAAAAPAGSQSLSPAEPPAATAPMRVAEPERQPVGNPVPPRPEPERTTKPSEQGSRPPQGGERPKAGPRKSRYAAPRGPAGPAQFRAIAAPAGSASGVRAYSFAATGGRMSNTHGAPVRIIRVR